MDFFKGLTGGGASNEPPASVLAEWNKYNGGDIESQGAPKAVAATQGPGGRTFLTTVQESVSSATGAFSGTQSTTTTQTCAAQPEAQCPTCQPSCKPPEPRQSPAHTFAQWETGLGADSSNHVHSNVPAIG